MVQISNQFIDDLQKLANIYNAYSIDNQEDIADLEKGLNTRYNTVQQIEMDEEKRAKQNKKGKTI